MAKILVVDDSPMDRRVAGELLQQHPDFEVEFCEEGGEAMGRLRAQSIDVVVTDLLMAPMNGLGLVQEARKKFPLVPVIIMTSLGNDSIAVQALRQGAASYVAKARLAEDLAATVRQVLLASAAQRRTIDVRRLITSSDTCYVLSNDLEELQAFVGHGQTEVSRGAPVDPRQGWRSRINFTEAEQLRINMAVYEALLNACLHGNLEISSPEQRKDRAFIAERSATPPYKYRHIHVRTRLTPDEAIYEIRDEGKGFDPTSYCSGEDTQGLDQESGRGIRMMHTIMNEVCYNDTGNEVTLIKRG